MLPQSTEEWERPKDSERENEVPSPRERAGWPGNFRPVSSTSISGKILE